MRSTTTTTPRNLSKRPKPTATKKETKKEKAEKASTVASVAPAPLSLRDAFFKLRSLRFEIQPVGNQTYRIELGSVRAYFTEVELIALASLEDASQLRTLLRKANARLSIQSTNNKEQLTTC